MWFPSFELHGMGGNGYMGPKTFKSLTEPDREEGIATSSVCDSISDSRLTAVSDLTHRTTANPVPELL